MNKLKMTHIFTAYAAAFLAGNDFASRIASQTFNSIFEFCNEQQALPEPGFECQYGPNLLLYAIQAWFIFMILFVLLKVSTKVLSLMQVLALTLLMYLFVVGVYLATSYWAFLPTLNELVSLPFDGAEYAIYYLYLFKEVIFAGLVAVLFVAIFDSKKFSMLGKRLKKRSSKKQDTVAATTEVVETKVTTEDDDKTTTVEETVVKTETKKEEKKQDKKTAAKKTNKKKASPKKKSTKSKSKTSSKA